MARALIRIPSGAKPGDVIEIRATIAHPMETGHRTGADGQLLPRDIITRFECRLDGALLCGADFYPAVAANPYFAFALRATKSGTLVFTWEGDNGFRHSESVPLEVASATQ